MGSSLLTNPGSKKSHCSKHSQNRPPASSDRKRCHQVTHAFTDCNSKSSTLGMRVSSPLWQPSESKTKPPVLFCRGSPSRHFCSPSRAAQRDEPKNRAVCFTRRGQQGTISRAFTPARSLSHEQRTGSVQGEARQQSAARRAGLRPRPCRHRACRHRDAEIADPQPQQPHGGQAEPRPAGGRPPPRHGNQRAARKAPSRAAGGGGSAPQRAPPGRSAAPPGRAREPEAATLPLPPPRHRDPGGGRAWWGQRHRPRTAAGPAQTDGQTDGLTSLPRPSHAAAGTHPTSAAAPLPATFPGGGRRRCCRFPLPVPGTAPHPSLPRRSHRPRARLAGPGSRCPHRGCGSGA